MSKRKPPGRRRRSPDLLDIIVGQNIRRLRIEAGMSQSTLGAYIGVTYQQVQKYEDGTDRIAASRLWKCAEAF